MALQPTILLGVFTGAEACARIVQPIDRIGIRKLKGRGDEMGHPDDRPGRSLREIAANRLKKLDGVISRLPPRGETVLLMEAARVLDQFHILDMNPKVDAEHHAIDFDIVCRGWNGVLNQLIARQSAGEGIAHASSTPETRAEAIALLRGYGECALLQKAASMVDAGIYKVAQKDQTLTVISSNGMKGDLFLDRLEQDRMYAALGAMGDPMSDLPLDDETHSALLDSLIRPFPTTMGQMVAYDADPQLDEHYFSIALRQADEARREAGLHPDTDFGSFTGADVSLVIVALIAFRRKHLALVDRAKKRWPETNFSMSVTIWGPRAELLASLQDLVGRPSPGIAAALDALVFQPHHSGLMGPLDTPYVPLLIKMHSDYLMFPISGAYRNAFSGARQFLERQNPSFSDALRVHRESWMAEELNALFGGWRYQTLEKPVLVRKARQIVTDIDAAILDNTTGELALFQLKWQDFDNNEPRKHQSRARNFTDEVTKWADRLRAWIAEAGEVELLKRLGFRSPNGQPPTSIHFFAIGRNGARFRSIIGKDVPTGLAVASWHQFVRMRHDIGPASRVLSALHVLATHEANVTPPARPVPLTLEIDGWTINLKDLFNSFEEPEARVEPTPWNKSPEALMW